MAKQKPPKGDCQFCGKEMTKGGLSRHIPSCDEYKKAVAAADKKKTGKNQPIYHLRVEDAHGGDFWLHMEMTGSAKLEELDGYLREIWLECCGHLSQFSIGGWGGDEIPMNKAAKDVFQKGESLTHIYDFGTSSHTTIHLVRRREGKPLSKHPIYLMARNKMPEVTCKECDQTAAWLCMECMYEYQESGLLCNDHVQDHPHDEYGEPLPLVNSPRLGMCGYDGPAEPPY